MKHRSEVEGFPVSESILSLIGNTPMVALSRIAGEGAAAVLGKLESYNPTGSVKDRIALGMVEDAEQTGRLLPGYTIVEPTSGNSGVALAMVAAARGYYATIVMPENAPSERKRLLTRFGARIHTTPSTEAMPGAIRAAEALVRENPTFLMLNQFENPANVRVHRETTGREILRDTGGRLDAFVAGVGTGGTITGVGEALKAANPDTLVVAVEPAASPLLQEGAPGNHGIPGLGPDFIPPILNLDVIDEVIGVTDEDAYYMTFRLAREEGLMVGISSGANVFAALRIAERLGPGKTVVTILPDNGERYVYTSL